MTFMGHEIKKSIFWKKKTGQPSITFMAVKINTVLSHFLKVWCDRPIYWSSQGY